MRWFRLLLLWLGLSIAGALLFEVLVSEPGRVIVSAGGKIYSMRLVVFVLLWALLWFLLWALAWTMLWPLRRFRRQARRAARARLANGLQALREGRHERAEALLGKAAELSFQAAPALWSARDAALAQERSAPAVDLLERLHLADPDAASLQRAEEAFAQSQYVEVLKLLPLDLPAKRHSPRGLELQCRALAAQQQVLAAQDHLQARRVALGLQGPPLQRLETDLAQRLIETCPLDALMMHWNALAPARREDADLIVRFLQRRIVGGEHRSVLQQLQAMQETQWRPALLRALQVWPSRDLGPLREALEAWLLRFSQEASLHLLLSRCQCEAGEHDAALRSAEQARTLQEGREALLAIARCHSARGDAAGAQRAYEEALKA